MECAAVAEAREPRTAEKEIVSFARGLDQGEFLSFYHANARPLWAYIYRVLQDPTLADDLLQEAFVRLLKAHPKVGDAGELRAYAFRVATNLIIDHWRRGKKERGWRPLEEPRNREGKDCNDLERRVDLPHDVGRLFAKLRPRERSLLWLAYVEGNDHKEIAGSLGLRERSIRVLLFRARGKLARLLQKEGFGREVSP